MPSYNVERVDISSCSVDADSPEEALEIANANPYLWDIAVGENEAILEE